MEIYVIIDNISPKHDPETTASKLNLLLLAHVKIHSSLLWMSANFIAFLLLGSAFGGTFRCAADKFYLKVCFSDHWFKISLLHNSAECH